MARARPRRGPRAAGARESVGVEDDATQGPVADDPDRIGTSLLVGIIAEGSPFDFTDPTSRQLRTLRQAAQKASARHPARHRVQFIVYVLSPLVKPTFHGVKLGSFTRALNQQNVLVAVPERIEADLAEFLARALEQGLQLAKDRLTKKGIGAESIDQITIATAEVVRELRDNHSPFSG